MYRKCKSLWTKAISIYIVCMYVKDSTLLKRENITKGELQKKKKKPAATSKKLSDDLREWERENTASIILSTGDVSCLLTLIFDICFNLCNQSFYKNECHVLAWLLIWCMLKLILKKKLLHLFERDDKNTLMYKHKKLNMKIEERMKYGTWVETKTQRVGAVRWAAHAMVVWWRWYWGLQ